jgi:DNA mismatch endonuclease, patch repair protein
MTPGPTEAALGSSRPTSLLHNILGGSLRVFLFARRCQNKPMDKLTPERRSWNMSRIRASNTGPEQSVRSLLHQMGFRFSLRLRDLPGRPDIVLPKWKTAIFVHGCFWHQHRGCRNCVMPKTRPDFWSRKLGGNVERDRLVARNLRKSGWRVVVVWECELEKIDRLRKKLQRRITGVAL